MLWSNCSNFLLWASTQYLSLVRLKVNNLHVMFLPDAVGEETLGIDRIITGYVPEVQEERIKFADDNHAQVFYDNDCDYYEDSPLYDEGSQVAHEDDYSQLTHYEE